MGRESYFQVLNFGIYRHLVKNFTCLLCNPVIVVFDQVTCKSKNTDATSFVSIENTKCFLENNQCSGKQFSESLLVLLIVNRNCNGKRVKLQKLSMYTGSVLNFRKLMTSKKYVRRARNTVLDP